MQHAKIIRADIFKLVLKNGPKYYNFPKKKCCG